MVLLAMYVVLAVVVMDVRSGVLLRVTLLLVLLLLVLLLLTVLVDVISTQSGAKMLFTWVDSKSLK